MRRSLPVFLVTVTVLLTCVDANTNATCPYLRTVDCSAYSLPECLQDCQCVSCPTEGACKHKDSGCLNQNEEIGCLKDSSYLIALHTIFAIYLTAGVGVCLSLLLVGKRDTMLVAALQFSAWANFVCIAVMFVFTVADIDNTTACEVAVTIMTTFAFTIALLEFHNVSSHWKQEAHSKQISRATVISLLVFSAVIIIITWAIASLRLLSISLPFGIALDHGTETVIEIVAILIALINVVCSGYKWFAGGKYHELVVKDRVVLIGRLAIAGSALFACVVMVFFGLGNEYTQLRLHFFVDVLLVLMVFVLDTRVISSADLVIERIKDELVSSV